MVDLSGILGVILIVVIVIIYANLRSTSNGSRKGFQSHYYKGGHSADKNLRNSNYTKKDEPKDINYKGGHNA